MRYLLMLSLIASLGASLVIQGGAFAFAPEGDLLEIKGFSPETIEMTEVQRSRQEWREPRPPRRTPLESVFHNIFYNNWTGSFDEFGESIIRKY